jgi:hypothetical protein
MSALFYLLMGVGGQTMGYPPLDVPAFIVCRFSSDEKSGSTVAAEGLALYFPLGIGKDATDKKIVDPHLLLEGRDLNLSIRTERSWTLQAKGDGSADALANGVKLTFTPMPQEGSFVAGIRGANHVWIGVCQGNTGPSVGAAYARAAENPKLLDIMK